MQAGFFVEDPSLLLQIADRGHEPGAGAGGVHGVRAGAGRGRGVRGVAGRPHRHRHHPHLLQARGRPIHRQRVLRLEVDQAIQDSSQDF